MVLVASSALNAFFQISLQLISFHPSGLSVTFPVLSEHSILYNSRSQRLKTITFICSWSHSPGYLMCVGISDKNGNSHGTSLAVQCLRLCTSIVGGTDLIPGWGTRILHATWAARKKIYIKKKKNRDSFEFHMATEPITRAPLTPWSSWNPLQDHLSPLSHGERSKTCGGLFRPGLEVRSVA